MTDWREEISKAVVIAVVDSSKGWVATEAALIVLRRAQAKARELALEEAALECERVRGVVAKVIGGVGCQDFSANMERHIRALKAKP